jgi:hypothetical protein
MNENCWTRHRTVKLRPRIRAGKAFKERRGFEQTEAPLKFTDGWMRAPPRPSNQTPIYPRHRHGDPPTIPTCSGFRKEQRRKDKLKTGFLARRVLSLNQRAWR